MHCLGSSEDFRKILDTVCISIFSFLSQYLINNLGLINAKSTNFDFTFQNILFEGVGKFQKQFFFVLISSENRTKLFVDFCPKGLKWVKSKKMKALYYIN